MLSASPRAPQCPRHQALQCRALCSPHRHTTPLLDHPAGWADRPGPEPSTPRRGTSASRNANSSRVLQPSMRRRLERRLPDRSRLAQTPGGVPPASARHRANAVHATAQRLGDGDENPRDAAREGRCRGRRAPRGSRQTLPRPASTCTATLGRREPGAIGERSAASPVGRLRGMGEDRQRDAGEAMRSAASPALALT